VEHSSLYLAALPPATAVTIKTYGGTAADVITDGVSEVVACKGSWESAADLLCGALDPALRVALFVAPLHAPSFEAAPISVR